MNFIRLAPDLDFEGSHDPWEQKKMVSASTGEQDRVKLRVVMGGQTL